VSPRGKPSRRQTERALDKRAAGVGIAEERSFEVAAAGARLDKLIATHYPDFSRARVQQLIEQGLVEVEGRAAASADRPAVGARVRLRIPEVRAARLDPVKLDLPVLYDDEDLLVIDKPAGLAVHPGAGGEEETVVHGLLHQVADLRGVGGELRPGIVHRLDKDTSGCLVVAKTEPALRGLQAQFKARSVEKRYRALVHGSPPERGELDTLMARHPTDRKRFSSKVREGRRAVTRFTVLGRAKNFVQNAPAGRADNFVQNAPPGRAGNFVQNSAAAWVDIELLTGRTHQIRAQFADRGWPLFCDRLYGGTKREGPSAPEPVRRAAAALGRQGLHAFRLAFAHPTTGALVRCEAPLPPDLRAALAELGVDPESSPPGPVRPEPVHRGTAKKKK
jgi:23S rRNA pseudouridine1911/1915/1917 synthase